jgi:hypothetical protein
MRLEKYFFIICVAALASWVAGCGGSSGPTPNPVSGLKKRVLITNSQNGAIQLLDGQNDKFNKTLLATSPTKIVTAGGISVVLNSGALSVTVVDNTKETVSSVVSLVNTASDVAISPDGKTGYAAVRNSSVVEVFNTSNGGLTATINVPSVTRLVMGPKGHKLLAFSDDPQNLAGANANAFVVIDTASNTGSIVDPTKIDASLNGAQPYTGIFDPSDTNDTTAFILNCGTECAGSAASSVAKMNFATPATPTVNLVTRSGSPPAITGATVGLLSGSNLFVAGTTTSPAGCTLTVCGSVQVINTGTLTAGTPIPITDGLHTQMALTSNNHLYIGASGCTPGVVVNNLVRGCLSILTTGTSAVTFTVESSLRSDLNVTGFQPISGRNVIYVIQGGELDIFDFTTDSLTSNQLDVVGHAVGVVQIDP